MSYFADYTVLYNSFPLIFAFIRVNRKGGRREYMVSVLNSVFKWRICFFGRYRTKQRKEELTKTKHCVVKTGGM